MSPILLAIFFIALVACLLRHAYNRPPNYPPGPPRLPLWGNLWQVMLRDYRSPHKALLAMSKEYCNALISVYVGAYPVVVANDHETVQAMLSHHAFQGRPDCFTVRIRSFNRLHGIFFTDGDYWAQQRRFSLRHLRDYGFGRRFDNLEAMVLEEVQGIVNILKGIVSPYDKDVARDGRVLLPELFAAHSTNTVLAVLTGSRLPAEQYPMARDLARLIKGFQRAGNASGGALDATPWIRFLTPSGFGFKDYMEGNDALLHFMTRQINEQKGSFDEEAIRGFCDKYLLEMQERAGENSSFTELQLLLTLMDYFFPASTAIPSALAFAVLYSIAHPDKADRAHQEIKDVVGLDRFPDLNDRVNLPYTEAFLRETLRLTGTPLTLMHRATEDSYFRGFYVPKDTLIVPNMWAAHHDPTVYEKPFEFMPERFLQLHSGQLKRKDTSVPFGLGKRLCAGETFARQNLFLFLAALLQGFRFAMPDGAAVPETEEDAVFGFIMTPPDDLWVQVSERV